MGYVTDCRNDVFLSYAHQDDLTWIAAFESALYEQLTQRLGQKPSVWLDQNKLRVGQNWVEEIEEAIASTAAFIAVLSPSYQLSEWCGKERNFFVQKLGGVEGMRVETAQGKMYRFLKVIRLPWEKNAHLEFFREAQNYDFFVRDAKREFDEVLSVGSPKFGESIQFFAFVVADLLRAQRRKSEAIFVASASEDVDSDRAALSKELRDQGYDVSAEPVDDFYADEMIERALERAVMSIHLIGAGYREVVNRQIDIARKVNKRMVFWISPQALSSARDRQAELLKRIRTAQDMPPDFWTLENGTAREKIAKVLNLLKPTSVPASAGRSAEAAPWMYLMCDPSTREDWEFAERLQSDIRSEERIDVALPETRLESARAIREAHERLLRECDGVLLYRHAAPTEWLWEYVPDVLFAERKFSRERPLRAKGFLLDQAQLLEGAPNVPVYSRGEHFTLDVIDPFLQSLRGLSA